MEEILARYQGRRADVIQALQDTQNAYGYISKAHLQQISRELSSPYSYTYAIATFYKSFALHERGRYVIKVCDGTACHLKLSDDIVDEIQSALGVGVGETTPDKLFSLEQVNCLGACAMAPVMAINDTLHGKLTRKKVRAILEDIRQHPDQQPARKAQAAASVSDLLEKGQQIVHKVGEFFEKHLEGK
jgi:NADH:ubiquinone oxidoreductase subunit E